MNQFRTIEFEQYRRISYPLVQLLGAYFEQTEHTKHKISLNVEFDKDQELGAIFSDNISFCLNEIGDKITISAEVLVYDTAKLDALLAKGDVYATFGFIGNASGKSDATTLDDGVLTDIALLCNGAANAANGEDCASFKVSFVGNVF